MATRTLGPMSFAELHDDFLAITASTVFCTATTVDGRGRPRNRILHPIFIVRDDAPVGWALTGKTPLKTRHLEANPHMACAFWTPSHDTVFIDAVTTWVTDEDELRFTWELFRDTPPPLGWTQAGLDGYGPDEWRSEIYTPLRLDPWRVQIMLGKEYPVGDLTGQVWRA